MLLFAKSSGQTDEFSIRPTSGLFSFGGSSAVSSSFINISDVLGIPTYINNPYGRNSGFSYGLALQEQRISKSDFIFGIQASYESLSSKVNIDHAYGELNWTLAGGEGRLTYQFLNFQPFFGKRIKILNGITTDMTMGIDMGICMNSKENGSVSTNQGDKFTFSFQPSKQNTDLRPRLELTDYYKKIGLTIGYSYGLTNYASRMDGANMKVYSRMIRLGLVYRF